MWDRLFQRLGHRYIAFMLLATRLCGSAGGVLVVYYVNLTVTLDESMRTSFIAACAVVVLVAVALSLACALWETRHLRAVLKLLSRGERPSAELGDAAGREAVLFPVRHHKNEAWLVPASTLIPVAIFLGFFKGASLDLLQNITLAVVMGVGLALMSTFFIIERLMKPVVRHLLDSGLTIDFDRLPANRMQIRLNLCFGLIILITALMIGTLANQRAADIIAQPDDQDAAVASLQAHTVYITLTAIAVGLIFSTTISRSVASRIDHLVRAMKLVEQGSFSEELRATGNDEVDILTRQFNSMVRQLAQHDATIRDLNLNLERKVEERTLSLRLLHAELDQRNTDLESALTDLRDMQSQLVEVAHRAGMTEIATGVLHNVGNVLNSVNVSVTVLGERIQKSKIASVSKVAELLGQHADAFARPDVDPKLKKIPEYLPLLAESLIAERGEMGEEVANLREKVQHIKNIINAQQNYTRRVAFKETIDVRHVIEDLLSIHGPAITKQQVRVDCDFAELPPTSVEKSKLLQVLDNLIKNALESMATVERGDHVLSLRSRREEDRAVITVTDTGHGIDEERLKNIFRFGFTTKSNGNGFGLHSAAIAMSEMGGSIAVASDGPDRGATFTVVLPLIAAEEQPAPEDAPQAADTALLNTV